MAIYTGSFPITGKLGDFIAYKRKDSDKIFIRGVGGVSKNRIRTDPNFVNTRRNNAEWKAVTLAGRAIRMALTDIHHLRDHNYTGERNALAKLILKEDKISEWGKRSIHFSNAAHILEGFSLNKRHLFETLLRPPLSYSVDSLAGKATVILPELIPSVNLYNPSQQSLYRFTCSVAAITDIIYDEALKIYRPAIDNLPFPTTAATPWQSWKENTPGTTLDLAMNNWQHIPGITLILSAGIEFGKPTTGGEIIYARNSGAGKVLKM